MESHTPKFLRRGRTPAAQPAQASERRWENEGGALGREFRTDGASAHESSAAPRAASGRHSLHSMAMAQSYSSQRSRADMPDESDLTSTTRTSHWRWVLTVLPALCLVGVCVSLYQGHLLGAVIGFWSGAIILWVLADWPIVGRDRRL